MTKRDYLEDFCIEFETDKDGKIIKGNIIGACRNEYSSSFKEY